MDRGNRRDHQRRKKRRGASVLDLAALIDDLAQPAPGDSPIGADLRLSGDQTNTYFTIKDARAAARDIERDFGVGEMGDIQSAANAHWRQVADGAAAALREATKDFEIAVWLVEALTRLQGFAGTAAGFSLLKTLVERYWDEGLYTGFDPETDDPEEKVAALTALNGLGGAGVLIRPLKMATLFEDGDYGPVAFWQYERAVAASRSSEEAGEEAQGDEVLSLDEFRQIAGRAAPQAVSATYADVGEALAAYRALIALMVEKVGDDAPPSSDVISTFEDIQRALRALAPFLSEGPAASEEEAADDGEGAAAGPAPRAAVAGAISGREDALRRLSEIADYFERTEPTSIIPLALRDLVRRARMPLTEILHELLPDEPAARDNFLLRAGIRPTHREE